MTSLLNNFLIRNKINLKMSTCIQVFHTSLRVKLLTQVCVCVEHLKTLNTLSLNF